MPLDFIDKYLIMKIKLPWGTNLSEFWIRNIGFYGIFLDDFPSERGVTLTVGASIWALLNQGDANA